MPTVTDRERELLERCKGWLHENCLLEYCGIDEPQSLADFVRAEIERSAGAAAKPAGDERNCENCGHDLSSHCDDGAHCIAEETDGRYCSCDKFERAAKPQPAAPETGYCLKDRDYRHERRADCVNWIAEPQPAGGEQR